MKRAGIDVRSGDRDDELPLDLYLGGDRDERCLGGDRDVDLRSVLRALRALYEPLLLLRLSEEGDREPLYLRSMSLRCLFFALWNLPRHSDSK